MSSLASGAFARLWALVSKRAGQGERRGKQRPFEANRFPLLREFRFYSLAFGKIHAADAISCDIEVGPDTMITAHVTIGNGVKIGRCCQIGASVFIGGGAVIGDEVTLHPHSVILPGVKVGDGAVVGAGAAVVSDVPARRIAA